MACPARMPCPSHTVVLPAPYISIVYATAERDEMGSSRIVKPADGQTTQPISGLPASIQAPENLVNVLFADDNPTSLKFGYHILNLLGCQVQCVTCGEEAVWAARSTEYDAIYMDLHMPGMNGYEATKWIKQELPSHKQPAILAITGDTSSGVTQRCVHAGMAGYITKPPSKEKFAQSLVQSLVRPGMRPGMQKALGPCIRSTGTPTSSTKTNRVAKWIDNWNFNPYEYCQKRPVQTFCDLGMEVFRQHGLLEEFNISYMKLQSYLHFAALKHSSEVDFHNLEYACSVVQAMHFFIKSGMGEKLEKFDSLILLVVCSVQNIDHPGENNAYDQQLPNPNPNPNPSPNP